MASFYQKKNLAFSYGSLAQITPHLSQPVLRYFLLQWDRIINSSKLAFATFPPSPNKLAIMKDSYFWHEIVAEILEAKIITVERVASIVETSLEFIRDLQCYTQHGHSITLPIGKELLILHAKVRPNLQKLKE